VLEFDFYSLGEGIKIKVEGAIMEKGKGQRRGGSAQGKISALQNKHSM
jgi:hypothetical protein